MADIELTEFISALRRDLLLSAAGSASESLRFAIDELELELEIKATRSDDTKLAGKVKALTFWVIGGLEGGGEKRRSSSEAQVHRITLKLKPVWKGDERFKLLIADEETEKPR